MSVYKTTYVIYGWILPYPDGKLEKEIEEFIYDDILINDFKIIIDNICGNYMIFGKVIISDEDTEWQFKKFPIIDTLNIMKEAKSQYKKIFKDDPKDDPILFMFSHIFLK